MNASESSTLCRDAMDVVCCDQSTQEDTVMMQEVCLRNTSLRGMVIYALMSVTELVHALLRQQSALQGENRTNRGTDMLFG